MTFSYDLLATVIRAVPQPNAFASLGDAAPNPDPFPTADIAAGALFTLVGS
jgi:hypothetical protein